MQNFGIKDTVLNEIRSLAEKHGVNKVILFGSRARGDYRRTSDIDLAAAGGNISEFMLDVDEQTSTLLKFDILDLDVPMQKELMDSIEREGIVIYEKV
ncbi:MAG: nucleotidyltransferase domain-containing protein [Clostridia bacterium]|nr:nucleotidyltransferase domain-containing protein [Clostridia bacterium]